MTRERRRNPRQSIELPAEVSFSNALLIGETFDLSLGGVRIVVDDMLDVGATVLLTLSVPAPRPASAGAGSAGGRSAAKGPGKGAKGAAKAATPADSGGKAAVKAVKATKAAALPDDDGDGSADADADADADLDADLDVEADDTPGASAGEETPFESSMTVRWTRARPDGRCIIGLSFGPLTAAERRELARVLERLA